MSLSDGCFRPALTDTDRAVIAAAARQATEVQDTLGAPVRLAEAIPATGGPR